MTGDKCSIMPPSSQSHALGNKGMNSKRAIRHRAKSSIRISTAHNPTNVIRTAGRYVENSIIQEKANFQGMPCRTKLLANAVGYKYDNQTMPKRPSSSPSIVHEKSKRLHAMLLANAFSPSLLLCGSNVCRCAIRWLRGGRRGGFRRRRGLRRGLRPLPLDGAKCRVAEHFV